MRVGIVDADLLGRKRHRFPNLACMKLSGYYKGKGAEVKLLESYEGLEVFDKVFISKVFTDTPCPTAVLRQTNVEYGGTGFFYDKASALASDIEHQFPDYALYAAFVKKQLAAGVKKSELTYYTDYSIGFLTRGCFRKCEFCVNKNYSHAFAHSSLAEFYDTERPKICLLDDNFFACSSWRTLLRALQETEKPFQFKQGLDERLLTPEKCELLFSSKYAGAYIFAFDNIADSQIIVEKIKLIRRYTAAVPVFYVFCAFDRADKWDLAFWLQDLRDLWTRLDILGQYGCSPYIMRFARYDESPFRRIYVNLARWCNQFSFFKKMSFLEFCKRSGVGSFENVSQFLAQYPEFYNVMSIVHFKKPYKEDGYGPQNL